jgi:hypothetical protein
MAYFDINGLYRITSANRTQSLTVNIDQQFPRKEPNAALQQSWTTGTKPAATYTMGPIANLDSQLWTFLPAGDGYWTIHNYANNQPDKQNPKKSVNYQDWCLELKGINLQLVERYKKDSKQQWYIQSTDDGEGKWIIQIDAKVNRGSLAQQWDVQKGSNQVSVTNGVMNPSGQAFQREYTYWEIEYVKPAVSSKTSKI